MAVTEISPIKYGRLLAQTLPKVIETRKEFDRAAALMEGLDVREMKSGVPSHPRKRRCAPCLRNLPKITTGSNCPRPEPSKAHIRKPAAFFCVSPALFL